MEFCFHPFVYRVRKGEEKKHDILTKTLKFRKNSAVIVDWQAKAPYHHICKLRNKINAQQNYNYFNLKSKQKVTSQKKVEGFLKRNYTHNRIILK